VRLPRIRLTAPQAPVLLTGLVWLVAIALSAWILAGWYWRLKAPVAIAAAPPEVTDPIAAAKLVSARHLFGETLQAAAPVVISRYSGSLPILQRSADSRSSPKKASRPTASSRAKRLRRAYAFPRFARIPSKSIATARKRSSTCPTKPAATPARRRRRRRIQACRPRRTS